MKAGVEFNGLRLYPKASFEANIERHQELRGFVSEADKALRSSEA